MSVKVIVGAQWGDEGKGKIVDRLTEDADVVVRYGGGANAGHTLVVDGEKVVLHLVPSGVLHMHTQCVIGPGTVVDPEGLVKELTTLDTRGVKASERVWIADRAHVVMPHHKIIDALREAGVGAIGTTRRGIGPTYEDKVGRRGVRMGDLVDAKKLRARLTSAYETWSPIARKLGGDLPSIEDVVSRFSELSDTLKSNIVDASTFLEAQKNKGARIVCEGAQGTMLDVDHGTYPFVTSSTTLSGGACAGAGLGPTDIKEVIGITKAYATRVGSGPFPSELDDATGERIRRTGSEFGATTGRPRRCGWLDAVALRYAVRVNGMTSLAMTKLDVLTGFEKIGICVGYRRGDATITDVPYDDLETLSPVYEWVEGWKEDLSMNTRFDALPTAARDYVRRVEQLAGVRIEWLGVGPGREQTLRLP